MSARSRIFHLGILAVVMLGIVLMPSVSAHEECGAMHEDPLGTLDDCVNMHFERGDILTVGIYKSLLSKAIAAQAAYARGEARAAIAVLEAFIGEVDALEGIRIFGDGVHLAYHAQLAIEQIAS